MVKLYTRTRVVSIVLLGLWIICLGTCFASEIEARYTYISTISCDISLSGNTISYTGIGNGSQTGTDTVLTVKLQRRSSTGSTWTTVESHGATAHGRAFAGYSGTATAERGFEYRVYVLCTIYDANDVILESKSNTSTNTVSY